MRAGFFVFLEFVETNDRELTLMTTGYRSGSYGTLAEAEADTYATLP